MKCLNCGFYHKIVSINNEEIEINVKSCFLCSGLKVIEIPLRIRNRRIKFKVKNPTLRNYVKGTPLTIQHLKHLIQSVMPLDLFDFNAYYDSTLSYYENKQMILEKLKEMGYYDKMVDLGIVDFDFVD